jgi:ELWxxDGT repeat protein
MRKAVSVLGLLAALSVHASAPELVLDINHGNQTQSSNASHFFSNGRVAYFFADDGSGSELWTSDGTTEGTRMVAELTPGREPEYLDSEDGGFTASGDLVYFWHTNLYEDDDLELWRTDGTREGTFRLARDLGYEPIGLAPIGARGIVARSDARFLATDGTVEGTHFVLGEVFPQQLVAFRGLVYFIDGDTLWRTDGTAAGTSRVGGFDDDFGDVREVVAGDDALYIVGDSLSNWEPYYVWRSDGTQPLLVTTFRKHPNDAPRLIASGGVVYALTGVDQTLTEIWRLGTTAVRTTVIEGDIESYTFLQSAGDRFYFATEKPDRLWRSDGTAAGTRVFEGVELSNEMLVTESKVFYTARGGVHVSDGTRTTDVTPNAGISSFTGTAIGDRIVLTVSDAAHGEELWVTDGTPQSTRLLKNIHADHGSHGASLHRLGDHLLFSAFTEKEGLEPWISDGTPWGTQLLADVERGSSSSHPYLFTALPNGRSVFVAQYHLFATDGNLTRLLRVTQADIYSGESSLGATLPVIDGRAWVIFTDNDGDELWSTDGTPGGTTKLVDLPSRREERFPLLAANRILYYVSRDALWRTDGTADGTFALASNPEQLHAAGDRLFFIADTPAHGRELWVTDGSLGGTHIVRDIRRGEDDAFRPQFPYGYTEVVMQSAGNVLFFAAADGVHGLEPWRSDGTEAGTFLLRDVAEGEASSILPRFDTDVTAYADGSLFFIADDGVHGHELWRTDLQRTTELVRDIAPRRGSSNPTHLRAIGDLVYFSADDGRLGRELWWATPANAGLVADVNPGPDSSLPREMTELDGAIYFFATTEETGDELWRVAPPTVPRRRSVR